MGEVEKLWKNKEWMEKVNAFNVILNQEPPKDWIKKLPWAEAKYLPIERMEWQMTSIFGKFYYEVKSINVIESSVAVTVRVHYWNPVLDEWEWSDGVGASPIVATEGEMAVSLALPAAKTFAVKDAVEPLGKIFGKDLNRADQIVYDNIGKKDKTAEETTRLFITAFKGYQGADKAELKKEMMDAVKNGWSDELVAKLHKKLKV